MLHQHLSGKLIPSPLQILENSSCEIIQNSWNHPLKEDRLISLLAGVDGVIAGFDEYTARVMESSNNLKVISLGNVVTTGHIAAYTYETIKEMALTSVKTLLAGLEANQSNKQ